MGVFLWDAETSPFEMPHEPYPVLAPIDPVLYDLDEDDKLFLKSQAGIQDDVALRDHVLQIQAEAYAVYI